MRVLLSLEHFKQAIKLQLIEKNESKTKNENEESTITESSNPTTFSVVKQVELQKTSNLQDSTLSKMIIKANQKMICVQVFM